MCIRDRYLGDLPKTRDPMTAQYLALTAAVERRRRQELQQAEAWAAQALSLIHI